MPCQQVVARGDGGFGVSAIKMGMDVAGLPHLEGRVEDVRPERCGLGIGIESLVEPALGMEHVGQRETGLGELGLDGERLAESVRGLVEIALGVTDEPDAEPGAGMVGAKRGSPAQSLGGAVEVALDAQRLAEIGVGLGPLRAERDRAAVGGERGIEPAGGLEHVAEVVVGAGVTVVEGDRPMQERRRLVHRIEPKSDEGARLQRLRVVGPGGEHRAVELVRLREPPRPGVARGAAHRLADASRREPCSLVSFRSASACRHPRGSFAGCEMRGDATTDANALSRTRPATCSRGPADAAPRNGRAFA